MESFLEMANEALASKKKKEAERIIKIGMENLFDGIKKFAEENVSQADAPLFFAAIKTVNTALDWTMPIEVRTVGFELMKNMEVHFGDKYMLGRNLGIAHKKSKEAEEMRLTEREMHFLQFYRQSSEEEKKQIRLLLGANVSGEDGVKE